jgi:peptidoglycan biosynthesis protein MviN/MurJ (putative lipid II flippase)
MEVNTYSQTAVATSSPISGFVGGLLFFVVFIFALVGIGLLAYFLWPYFAKWYRTREREKESLKYILIQVTVPRVNEVSFLGHFMRLKPATTDFGIRDFLPGLNLSHICLLKLWPCLNRSGFLFLAIKSIRIW